MKTNDGNRTYTDDLIVTNVTIYNSGPFTPTSNIVQITGDNAQEKHYWQKL